MRAFLIILAILVALVFGVLFAAPLVIDPEDYRGDVQAGLSRALGQPVRLEGELAFRILPTPRLTAGGVVVEGGSARDLDPILTARRAEMRLSLGGLLAGEFLAERIELVEPVITLHADLTGRTNYAGLRAPDQGDGLSISVLGISGGVLNYRDQPAGRALSASDLSGEINLDGSAGSVTGHLAGVWQGRDVDVNFRLGQGARPSLFVEMNLDDTAMARFQGRLADPAAGVAEGQFEADIADLRAFENLFALVPPGEEPVPLRFRAGARLDGSELVLDGISGMLADAAFGGRFSADLGASPSLDVALAFDKLAGPPLLASLRHWPDGAATAARALDRLPELGAAIRLDVGLVEFGDGYVRQFTLDARLANGALSIGRVSALLPGGSDLAFSGELRLAAGAYRLEGSVEMVSDNLVSLLEWSGATVPLDARGRLRNLSLSAAVGITSDVAQITGIDLRLDQSRLTGGIAIALVERPSFSLDVAVDQINADAYAGLFGLRAWRWSVLTPDPAAPRLPLLDRFDTNAIIRIDRLVAGAEVAEDVLLEAGLLDGNLTLTALRIGALQGAEVLISGRVDTPENPQFALEAKVTAPDMGAFLGALGATGGGMAGRLRDATLDAGLEGGFASAAVSVAFGSAELDGRIEGAVADWLAAPQLDLRVSLDSPSAPALRRLAFPDWRLPFALAGPVTVEGTVTGSPERLGIAGRMDAMAARLDLTGEVGGNEEGETAYRFDARLRHGDVIALMESLWSGYRPSAAGGAALDATAVAEGGAFGLRLAELEARAGDDRLSGAVGIDWRGKPEVVANVTDGRLDLGPYLPKSAAENETGGRRWSLSPIGTSWLRGVRLDATVDMERLTADGLSLAPFHASLAISDGRMVAEDLRGGIGEGEIGGRMTFGADGVPFVEAEVQGRGVQLSPMLAALLGELPALEGDADFEAALEGRGVTAFDMIRALSGRIEITRADLAFDPVDETLPSPDLEGLAGTLEATRGVLRTTRPFADAGGAATIIGSIDLPRWRLDLELRGLEGAGGADPGTLSIAGPLDAPRLSVAP
ncbi:MAG: hypothetical protein TEF_16570 [Rhizobiales bacterium NRL2]|nr:MAG: hypothetical protein TEF_16570 [Rhizobiales bacterium NRL2]